MKKSRLREVSSLPNAHLESKWQSQDLNPGRVSLPSVILAPSGQRIDEMLNLLFPLPSSSHPYSSFAFSSQGLVLLKN